MKVSIRKHSNQTLIVRMQGCLDASQVAVLEMGLTHALWEAGNVGGQADLVVDLGEVSFLDSVGLKTLTGRLRQSEAQGAEVCLVWPQSDAVRDSLSLIRYDRVFPFNDSLDAALQHLS